MSNSNQPYEEIARLNTALPKGGGNLPPPFQVPHGLTKQPYEKFVRLTGPWRRGADKLSRPFAAPKSIYSTRDSLSRVDPFGRVIDAFLHGGKP